MATGAMSCPFGRPRTLAQVAEACWPGVLRHRQLCSPHGVWGYGGVSPVGRPQWSCWQVPAALRSECREGHPLCTDPSAAWSCLARGVSLPAEGASRGHTRSGQVPLVLSATLGEDDRVVVGRHDEDGFLRSCAAPWWRGTRFGQVTGGATARV